MKVAFGKKHIVGFVDLNPGECFTTEGGGVFIEVADLEELEVEYHE